MKAKRKKRSTKPLALWCVLILDYRQRWAMCYAHTTSYADSPLVFNLKTEAVKACCEKRKRFPHLEYAVCKLVSARIYE